MGGKDGRGQYPCQRGVQCGAASGSVAVAGMAAANAPNPTAFTPRLTAGCQVVCVCPHWHKQRPPWTPRPRICGINTGSLEHWLQCCQGRSARSVVWLSKALQPLRAHASSFQTRTPAAVGGATARRQRQRQTGRAPTPPVPPLMVRRRGSGGGGGCVPRARGAGCGKRRGRAWAEAEGGPGGARGWPATPRRGRQLAINLSKNKERDTRCDCRRSAAALFPPPTPPPFDAIRDGADDAHRPRGRLAGPAPRAARSSGCIFLGGVGGRASSGNAQRCRARVARPRRRTTWMTAPLQAWCAAPRAAGPQPSMTIGGEPEPPTVDH